MSYGIPGQGRMGPLVPGQAPIAPMQVPKAIRRIGEQAIWSSQRYANATAVANTANRLFTTPRGQVGQGFAAALTLAETSLKEGGRIPAQFAFTVDGVSCQLYNQDSSPVVYQDVANATNNGVLQWDFVQTQFDIAPVALIGAGGGPYGDTADTGAVDGGFGSRVVVNNGNGALWVYRAYPVLLPADSTFAIIFTWGSGAAVIDGGLQNAALIARVSLLGRFQTAIAVG